MERYETSSIAYDNLVHNPENLVTRNVTILSGQSIARGEIIGKITLSVPTTGTAGGTNAGQVTCTSVSGGSKTKLGTYTITCITTGTNTGTFSVKDPDGYALPTATLGAAYTNNQINFTLNDVGTDPSLGDSFTIVVAAGSGSYKKAVATNVDGSNQVQNLAVSANAIDASGGAVNGTAYVGGVFNESEITIDSSYTLANIKDELVRYGISFKSAILN